MTIGIRRKTFARGRQLVLLVTCSLFGAGGCVPIPADGLAPGTYGGELSCTITAVNPEGVEGTEDFTMSVMLVVDSEGMLTVNDEPIEVGAEVTRSIPTADLAFEVLTISPGPGQVEVTYAPRPTLPGIEVTGDLTEEYAEVDGGVRLSGRADLVLTDVSGDSMFEIECSGTLPPQ